MILIFDLLRAEYSYSLYDIKLYMLVNNLKMKPEMREIFDNEFFMNCSNKADVFFVIGTCFIMKK